MKAVKLEKDYTIKLKSKITDYLDPDFVYVPILNRALPFKKNEEVTKEQELFPHTYASVSGNILGIKECEFYNKEQGKCLVIANNFQEKTGKRQATRKKISQITMDDLRTDLKDLDPDRFLNKENVTSIIMSGIDEEPYIATEIFYQKENTKIILETLDALLQLFPGSTAYIAIKNMDGENIAAYQDFLGTYQNINLCLVDDYYLIGEEQFLPTKLNIKGNYIYLKAHEVYTFYQNMKKRKALLETYLTVSGDAVPNPQVFNVKLGTKVSDLLFHFYATNFNTCDIYANGLMHGKKIDIEKLIVTKDLQGIVIMTKKNSKEQQCLLCGKCLEVCPINSNPLLALQKKDTVKCIECGLCTYICPAHINLAKYLRGDNNE